MPAQITISNTSQLEPKEPANYLEAVTCADSHHWIPAIFEEFDCLVQNETWDLCELPAERQAMKGK